MTSGEGALPGGLASWLERLESKVVGQRPLLSRLIVAWLAGGHVLIEGVPGLAKTRAAKALADSVNLPFRRVSFVPDLLPSDLIGTVVYRPETASFEPRPGPIVTNVLLADEVNRAPAKVQSALLEAMEEKQVTLGDLTIVLPRPFLVLATQNPIEQEGTFPLPEAQLDRFLMKLVMGPPDRAAERSLLDRPELQGGDEGPGPPPLFDGAGLLEWQDRARGVHLAPPVKDYLVAIVRATRDRGEVGQAKGPWFEWGASPRSTLMLARAARALALFEGRDHVLPHDVKSLAPDVLRHRVLPDDEALAEGLDADDLIAELLGRVSVP